MIVLLNRLKASTVKFSRNFSRKEIVRPILKSMFVYLGKVEGLRTNQDARPPVALAKVLTSAPVIPPLTPPGAGAIKVDPIFAANGWPVADATMPDAVQPSANCRAIALEKCFPYVGCHTTLPTN